MMDHKNQIRDDNRFCNIRPANKWQNSANTKDRSGTISGARGVYYETGKWKRKRWIAYINHNGKRTHLGHFLTKEEAVAARAKAVAMYHDQFANHYEAPANPSMS